MRKTIKYLLLLIFFLSAPVSIYSNYWLYTNKTNPISISVKEDVDEDVFEVMSSDAILVHNQTEKLDPLTVQEGFSDIGEVVSSEGEVDYSGQNLDNISSPKDIISIRESSREPLYLRGYLVIPSIGVKERIMEGLGEATLTYGVGTMNPSSHPSQYGTYALAGHNFGDWDYGTGFSKLQKHGDSIVGEKAYITYGDIVYEYEFIDVKQMFRDYSMAYTETDWNSRNLSGIIPQYTDDYQVIPGTQALRPGDFYANRDVNPNLNYNYGKTLTLYTCHVMPPDYRFSMDRIIARAVQVDSYSINEAPEAVKRNLIAEAPRFKNPFTLTAQAKTFTATKLDNIDTSKPNDKNLQSNPNFINRQLSKDPRFMERVAIISTGIMTGSLVILIVTPWRSKGNG